MLRTLALVTTIMALTAIAGLAQLSFEYADLGHGLHPYLSTVLTMLCTAAACISGRICVRA